MPMDQCNAKIKSTFLGREDHGIFTAILDLEAEDGNQGFGNYFLDKADNLAVARTACERLGTERGLEFIMEVLHVLRVASWERLPGAVCRIRRDGSERITAIGHIIEDRWFCPGKLLGGDDQ